MRSSSSSLVIAGSICALVLALAVPWMAGAARADAGTAARPRVQELAHLPVHPPVPTAARPGVVRIQMSTAQEILEDPGSPIAGNPEGDVTVVEFFDYRCGYCKRVHPKVKRLVKEDGSIRFVFKEFPILGPTSEYAARAALASREQRRYQVFHDKLMAARGKLTKSRVIALAKTVGINTTWLQRDIENGREEFDAIFAENYDLADTLDISGTPAFVIGDNVIRGAISLEEMRDLVAEARELN